MINYPPHLKLTTLDLAKGSRSHLVSPWRVLDESRVLGHGRQTFARASEKLLCWQVHEEAGMKVTAHEGWVELKCGPTTNECDILLIDAQPAHTIMVYGTRARHLASGEEAFIISIDSHDTVTGRCVAFSQPNHWITTLGAPAARWAQRRITQRYLAAMARQ
ncbi:DUF1990 domain-containing protein [Corynebacterium felinum]|nr:DUF1990 domain-containing protein [Corynebacterium felinum]MDF5820041.1 DUF1990 domain-containing protein [Corynebacterium felinum]WJY95051.1 hypothetical protein CFELI_07180 [Corynebacterium felinum]